MSKTVINAGQMPAVIAVETNFGVARFVFVNSETTTKGIRFPHSKESPITIKDSNGKELVSSVNGYQGDDVTSFRFTAKNVSASISHALGLNSFVSIARMFFQNYIFAGLVIDTTITSVVDNVENAIYSDITVASVENMKINDTIVIGGRTDTNENAEYMITAINGLVITIDDNISSDENTGTIKSIVASHKFTLENMDDCSSSYIDDSFSLHLPDRLTNPTACAPGGELVVGMVPTKLSLKLSEAMFTADIIAREYIAFSTNNPSRVEHYKIGSSSDGYYRTNFAKVELWNDVSSEWELKSFYDIMIELELKATDDNRSRTAGLLDEAVVDGTVFGGSMKTLLKTEDTDTNMSRSIFVNRDLLRNGGKFRFSVTQGTGESISLVAYVEFLDPEREKEQGGNSLNVPFKIVYNNTTAREAFEMEVVNSYLEDLKTIL